MGSAWHDDAPLKVSGMSDVVWHHLRSLVREFRTTSQRFTATFCIKREQDRASLISKIVALLVLFSMIILVGTI